MSNTFMHVLIEWCIWLEISSKFWVKKAFEIIGKAIEKAAMDSVTKQMAERGPFNGGAHRTLKHKS